MCGNEEGWAVSTMGRGRQCSRVLGPTRTILAPTACARRFPPRERTRIKVIRRPPNMAHFAYYGDNERLGHRKNFPTKERHSHSVADIGAPEDGFYLRPVKRTAAKPDLVTSKELIEQLENVPHSEVDKSIVQPSVSNLRFKKKHEYEEMNGSLRGAQYLSGKESPKRSGGRRHITKELYPYTYDDGHGADTRKNGVRMLKRFDIKLEKDAAGVLLKRDALTIDPNKEYPSNWWMRDGSNRRDLLAQKVAEDQGWFSNPITDAESSSEPPDTQHRGDVDAKDAIKSITERKEPKPRRGVGEATFSAQFRRVPNPVYHIPFVDEASTKSGRRMVMPSPHGLMPDEKQPRAGMPSYFATPGETPGPCVGKRPPHTSSARFQLTTGLLSHSVE